MYRERRRGEEAGETQAETPHGSQQQDTKGHHRQPNRQPWKEKCLSPQPHPGDDKQEKDSNQVQDPFGQHRPQGLGVADTSVFPQEVGPVDIPQPDREDAVGEEIDEKYGREPPDCRQAGGFKAGVDQQQLPPPGPQGKAGIVDDEGQEVEVEVHSSHPGPDSGKVHMPESEEKDQNG